MTIHQKSLHTYCALRRLVRFLGRVGVGALKGSGL